jgi:hypothetical protein
MQSVPKSCRKAATFHRNADRVGRRPPRSHAGLSLILAGAGAIAVGVWLARVSYLAGGGLALWAGVTALAPSPGTLIVSGLALVGISIWLSLGSSPLRAWLSARPLPAPERR